MPEPIPAPTPPRRERGPLRYAAGLARGLRDVWLIAGITLALVVGLEWVLSMLPPGASSGDARSRRSSPREKSRARADAYGGAEWPRAYFEEFHRLDRSLWVPYVYWRRSPLQGEFITVDASGRRITPQQIPPGRTQTPPRIFFFGGSTMWGTGARDASTIPALVGKGMADQGSPIVAENFGEAGYVSTQEVIAFQLEVRDGNHPAAAVFYSGVNDLFSVYQHRVAGLPHNEGNRVTEFGLSLRDKRERLYGTALSAWMDDRAIVRTLRKVVGRETIRFDWGERGESGPWRKPVPEEQWPGDVARRFQVGSKTAAAIADSRGIGSRFYLQPTLFHKPVRTPYEQGVSTKHPGLDQLAISCYEAIRKEMETSPVRDRFRDLSDIFKDESAPMFIDWCHIAEAGNERIARAMEPDLARLARQPKPGADAPDSF